MGAPRSAIPASAGLPPSVARELPASELERARAAVRVVAERIARRIWPFDRVRADFCARPPARVLEDGEIHYATPCHDLCSVATDLLLARGLEPTLVLGRIKRFFQPVKFQCGIELTLDGAPWYVGFSETTSRLAAGRFVVTRSRTAIHRARPLGPGLPHLAHFGVTPATLDRLVEGHDLDRHLRSYRRTCATRPFERTRRRALRKWAEAGPAEGLVAPGRWGLDPVDTVAAGEAGP